MLTKLSAVAIAVTTGLLSYSVHFDAQAEQATSVSSVQVSPDQAAASHKNVWKSLDGHLTTTKWFQHQALCVAILT